MNQCSPLPGRRITLGCTTYFVHGLAHAMSGISLSPDFKKLINDKLRGYFIISEDGFANWIENTASFNEIKYFGLDKVGIIQYLAFLKDYIYSKFIKKVHQTDLMRRVQEMRTLENLDSIREKLFESYLPEPDGMNSLLSRLGKGTLENPKGEFPLRIRRYIYEAKESIRYAKENQLPELHVVVGCAHEPPLEYLLSHPEILRRYSL